MPGAEKISHNKLFLFISSGWFYCKNQLKLFSEPSGPKVTKTMLSNLSAAKLNFWRRKKNSSQAS
jgi:hypothetical protein